MNAFFRRFYTHFAINNTESGKRFGFSRLIKVLNRPALCSLPPARRRNFPSSDRKTNFIIFPSTYRFVSFECVTRWRRKIHARSWSKAKFSDIRISRVCLMNSGNVFFTSGGRINATDYLLMTIFESNRSLTYSFAISRKLNSFLTRFVCFVRTSLVQIADRGRIRRQILPPKRKKEKKFSSLGKTVWIKILEGPSNVKKGCKEGEKTSLRHY